LSHSDGDLSPTFFHIQTQTGWGRTLARMADWCHPKQDWVALDAGCGPGQLPALLAERGCRSFGVDISWDAFVEGRLHPNLIQGSAQALPFPSNTFHLITASNLLFLLHDPLPVLLEFKRLLRPMGRWLS
jgi:ubiquinone/menaquinone biosynthesis C-methylase UbiE